MAYRVCLIEGDGIGREVIPAARRVLEALGGPTVPVSRHGDERVAQDGQVPASHPMGRPKGQDESSQAGRHGDRPKGQEESSQAGRHGDERMGQDGQVPACHPMGRHGGRPVRGIAWEFDIAEAGWGTYERLGTALPEETVAACREADAVLFGAVSSPLAPVAGYRSPIVALRRELGLYANLRPARSQPVPASRQGIDLLIVRENTEGLYAGREQRAADEAVTERVITRSASERIVRRACELARGRRGSLTIVHKANVLRATCGLFREVAFAVAAEYPDVRAEEMLVDAAATRLVTDPERFDVVVTTNLFGDILSDEAAGLVGGLGLAPSANVGDDGRRGRGVFEPVHGSAPDIAGRGIANPTGAILAAAMMLDHLGEGAAAEGVHRAVEAVLRDGPHTPDLGGNATTDDVTRAVIGALREL